MIAALFVETNGSYFNLPGVDPWDEARDARRYAGPHPVVAHPPCQRWGKFWAGQPAWIARTGERKVKGDDGGCFEQGRYGHYARKPTLLYAVGVKLPELRWGKSEPVFPQWAIDRYGLAKCKRAGELAFKGGGKDNTHRIGTPAEFRDLLIGMARTAARAAA